MVEGSVVDYDDAWETVMSKYYADIFDLLTKNELIYAAVFITDCKKDMNPSY